MCEFLYAIVLQPPSHLCGRIFIDCIDEWLTPMNLCWHRNTFDCITFHNHCMGGMWGLIHEPFNMCEFDCLSIDMDQGETRHSQLFYHFMSIHVPPLCILFILVQLHYFLLHLSPRTSFITSHNLSTPYLITSAQEPRLLVIQWDLGPPIPVDTTTPVTKLYISLHFDDPSNGAIAGD